MSVLAYSTRQPFPPPPAEKFDNTEGTAQVTFVCMYKDDGSWQVQGPPIPRQPAGSSIYIVVPGGTQGDVLDSFHDWVRRTLPPDLRLLQIDASFGMPDSFDEERESPNLLVKVWVVDLS